MATSRAAITSALRSLGVQSGDLLLAHTSLSSLGHVPGGAPEAAQALVDAVSPGGTVFVPTFTYDRSAFDPATSPSLVGAISEALRGFPGAVRSNHPTHSLAGIGPAAAEILAGHSGHDPFGPGSPLWRLYERDAWVLLLGCDHRANSMIHVAEELAGPEVVPYLTRTRTARLRNPDGSETELTVRRPGCSAGFNAVAGPLLGARNVHQGHAGAAPLILVRAADVVYSTANLLRSNPAALLCHRPDCDRCDEAHQMIAAAK